MNFYPFRDFFYAPEKRLLLGFVLPLLFMHTPLSAFIARNNGETACTNGKTARNNGDIARNNGYIARNNGYIARNNVYIACSGT